MKYHRFLCILLALSLLLAAIPFTAICEDSLDPQSEYVSSMKATLSINGSKASVQGYITPKASTETRKVSIIVYLQRKENGKWRSLDSWSGSATNARAKASGSKTIERGYEYRALAVGRISTAEGVLLERPTSASSSQSY